MSDAMYVTGEGAMAAYASQQDDDINDRSVQRGQAAMTVANRTFINHDTNISVRSDYNRNDYEYFRPSDTVPQRQNEIIGMCMEAYQKVGLVRNVIDLMGDFGAQGIRLQHSTPSIQEFYNTWWKKVGGIERSERFLNQLYRCGQVIIKKSYGKVSNYQEKKWRKGVAKEEIKIERIKTNAREIPLKYRFINPLNVEVIAGDLAQFVGAPTLGLKISMKLRSAVSQALKARDKMSPQVRKMIEKIPKDVLAEIKRGSTILPLDVDKTSIYYYKKDDWMLWANPMCYCILDDLLMLNKLKLADISALDGAISNIRLWKLGIIGDSPANSILPTKSAINKLRSILANNLGGGVLDLVWGPELTFEESNSQVWRWLGSEKYNTTIMAIYEGLGIPASLRGSGNGSTNTGNFIGLNTLIKRLQYGRELLTDFWTQELKYIHKAMGFVGAPPQIMFDFMALADEAAEKQLLVNLWDRDIISDETVLEIFGRLPTIEKARVKREANNRTNEVMPYKASPFHNPDKEHDYRKILLQGGQVAPSEIGIDLNDRKVDEKNRLEIMHEKQKELKEIDVSVMKEQKKADFQQQKELKKMGTPGRPNNVTETKKRKPKPSDRPNSKASFVDTFIWANAAQETISALVTPSLLYAYDKKNMRSLSREEFDEIERIKFNILCSLEPFDEITNESVYNSLANNYKPDKEVYGIIKTIKAQFISSNNRQPKVEELRQIYSSSYALLKEE